MQRRNGLTALVAIALVAAVASCILPRGTEAAGETLEQRVADLERRVCILEGGSECAAPPPSPSAVPSPTAAVTASPSPVLTPSPTPTPIPTASPTPIASPTATATPTTAPVGSTVTLEAQAWWNRDGIRVPEAPGHHVHVAATIPTPGRIVNGRVDIPVDITLHDQESGPNWIRWADVDNVLGVVELDGFDGFNCVTHDGFTDCKRRVILPVDFSDFQTGLRELRISVNIPDEQPDVDGGQRMFNSTGWQVAVRSLTPEYRSGPEFVEARGWYDNRSSDTPGTLNHEYQNALLSSGIESVRAGGTITVRLRPGSGGLDTVYSLVTIDPDMHRHIAGRVLLERDGEFSGSVTIPSDLAPGAHKLTLLASDGKNAGVLVVPFVVS